MLSIFTQSTQQLHGTTTKKALFWWWWWWCDLECELENVMDEDDDKMKEVFKWCGAVSSQLMMKWDRGCACPRTTCAGGSKEQITEMNGERPCLKQWMLQARTNSQGMISHQNTIIWSEEAFHHELVSSCQKRKWCSTALLSLCFLSEMMGESMECCLRIVLSQWKIFNQCPSLFCNGSHLIPHSLHLSFWSFWGFSCWVESEDLSSLLPRKREEKLKQCCFTHSFATMHCFSPSSILVLTLFISFSSGPSIKSD